ncbi:hypothetical protein Pmani_018121 [Petrolisthes manimaculis]|uniref:Ionotropic glutamate receptor C-terminal domain-containing protein n=1 Tax=Petrolisthes manimaculis TaxID=1843537 RepID=A0AAE1PNC8_9EUCA|nr:hypothetical protein Pmani_018121 [Petrolisthes manimaculis]
MWNWERIVLGMWMLATLVISRSYGGNLMSLLAVRHIPQPYQSLRDVLDDPSVTMIWEANSAYVQYYRELVVTDDEAVICIPRQENESSLAPSGKKRQTLAACCVRPMLQRITTVRFKFKL